MLPTVNHRANTESQIVNGGTKLNPEAIITGVAVKAITEETSKLANFFHSVPGAVMGGVVGVGNLLVTRPASFLAATVGEAVTRGAMNAARDSVSDTVSGLMFKPDGAADQTSEGRAAAIPPLPMEADFLARMTDCLKTGTEQMARSGYIAAIHRILQDAVQNAEQEPIEPSILRMLAIVERATSTEMPVTEIKKELEEIMRTEGFQILVHGRYPTVLFNSLSTSQTPGVSLQELIRPTTPTAAKLNNDDMIAIAKTSISETLCTKTALQAANYFVGLDEPQMRAVMGNPTGGADQDPARVLERLLDQKFPSFAHQLCARFTFTLATWVAKFSIPRFLTGVIEQIQARARDSKSNPRKIQEQNNAIITEIVAFLRTLQGAQETVQGQRAVDTVADQMHKALAPAEFNRGYTAQELYSRTIEKAIYQVLPPFGFTTKAQGFIQDSHVFTKALFYGLIYYPFVWTFEGMSNYILRKTLHFILIRTNALQQVLDSSLSEVALHGYQDSINNFLHQQLLQIEAKLNDSSEQADHQESQPLASPQALRDLVSVAFNVLERNRELRSPTQKNTLMQMVRNTINAQAVDATASTLGLILGKATSALLDPNEIDNKLNLILTSIASGLESEPTDPSSQEDRTRLEQEIEQAMERILSKALATTIHQQVSGSSSDAQDICNKYYEELKAILTDCRNELQRKMSDSTGFQDIISEYATKLKSLQARTKNTPASTRHAQTLDRHYMEKVPGQLEKLRSSVDTAPKEAQIAAFTKFIEELKPFKMLNTTPFTSLTQEVAEPIQDHAYQEGLDFFRQAGILFQEPYVLRYGLIHRPLIAFVGRKGV
jgi:hypothetical protein